MAAQSGGNDFGKAPGESLRFAGRQRRLGWQTGLPRREGAADDRLGFLQRDAAG